MRSVSTLSEMTDIISSHEVVFVKVGAEFCGPCTVVEKSLVEIEPDFPDIEFVKVDADDADDDLVDSFEVTNIPLLVMFVNGDIVVEEVGLRTKEQLVKIIGAHLNK